MRRQSIKELQETLRQAEAALEAATKRSDVNAATRKVMRAKEAAEEGGENAGSL